MNPQMQQYRQQYAQAQTRSPAAARRPGECDPSTWNPQYPSPGSSQNPYPSSGYAQSHYGPTRQPVVHMTVPRTPPRSIAPQQNLLRSFQPRMYQPQPQPMYQQAQASQPPRNHHHPQTDPTQLHLQRMAQFQRVWNTMSQDQREQYLENRALHLSQERDAEINRNAYLPSTGAMQPNANQAAAQHQRQIYEQQMAQRNAALEHQLAQRRARKPTDRNMPEGIEDLVIGDGVQQYKDLREVEKKLDYAMMRKRLDIQDTVNRNVKRQKTMRIWISNTVENQPWQRPALDENSFDFNSGADATYKVKIEGKILDEPEDDVLNSDDEKEDHEMADAAESKPEKKRQQSKHKFSHYFKSISVEFDKIRNTVGANPNIDPSMQIEWKKNPQSTDFDCLEFTRKGDETLNITFNLVRDEQLERYRLSQALAGTLDMEEADRAEVVMGIWEYVKAMGLQEDEERRLVRCDERLKAIFGRDTFLFPQVADHIMPHLHPLTPIKLQYTIRVDQDFFTSQPSPSNSNNDSNGTSTPASYGEPTIYDVTLTTTDPLRTHLLSHTQSSSQQSQLQTLRQINMLDDQLALLVQGISHHKARHAFFRSFAKDPVAFLRKWYASQQHDLSVLLGEVEKWDIAGLEFAKGGSDGVWGDRNGADGIVREVVRGRLGRESVAR